MSPLSIMIYLLYITQQIWKITTWKFIIAYGLSISINTNSNLESPKNVRHNKVSMGMDILDVFFFKLTYLSNIQTLDMLKIVIKTVK